MATTTPNYGWPVPTSTDLVKNGATAIEALGDAIDASIAELKGGTTGQVLSKTSNTDMDFTWVAQDDSNAIQNSIVDAKGDLIAASANDTPARLAVGNNGETLVADSSTSTGLRYQAPVAVNPIINGGSDIWQRGTSAAMNSGAYTYAGADRWMYYQGGGAGTISRQASGLEGIQYCQRWARNSGSTSTLALVGFSNVESANCYPFAGKTVTYSFYARAGANFSSSNGLQYFFFTGTGTDQNVGFGGFTNQVTAISGNATLTTSWQRFQFTATLGSTVTQFAPWFQYTPTGTAGANDYFEVTGLQLEVGSVATPFRRSGGTIQGELAACQRYYFRNTPGVAYGSYAVNTIGVNSTTAIGISNVPVQMRTVPTSVDFSGLFLLDGTNNAPVTNVVIGTTQTGNFGIFTTFSTASGLVQYRPWQLGNNNNVNGYLGFSAEL